MQAMRYNVFWWLHCEVGYLVPTLLAFCLFEKATKLSYFSWDQGRCKSAYVHHSEDICQALYSNICGAPPLFK